MYESDRRVAGDTRQKHVVGRRGDTAGQGCGERQAQGPPNTHFCDVRVKALYFNGEGAGKKRKDLKRKLRC